MTPDISAIAQKFSDLANADIQVWLRDRETPPRPLKEWMVGAIEEATASLRAQLEGGLGRIAAERMRQISSEHWTPKHDDEHKDGELAIAAACYASPEPIRAKRVVLWNCGCRSAGECQHDTFPRTKWTDPWPWSEEWDKRKKHSRIRQLEIAGALIAAEIDRLQRAPQVAQESPLNGKAQK